MSVSSEAEEGEVKTDTEGLSPRKELDYYMNEGRLRDAVAGDLSEEATDLLLRIVDWYCAPRRPALWKRQLRAERAASRTA